MGKPLDIVRRLRQNFLSEVQAERKKREGCFVKGELTLRFPNHVIKHGTAEARLGHLGVSTSSTLVIPELKPSAHTLETAPGVQKELIAETASNDYGHYTIVHEKSPSGDAPNKIQVHFTDKKGAPTVPTFIVKVEIEVR